MKKYIAYVSLPLLVMGLYLPSIARADMTLDTGAQNSASAAPGLFEVKDTDTDTDKEQKIEEMEQEEVDVHNGLNGDSERAKISLAEIDETQLNTYGDAVKVLQSFQVALQQIKTSDSVQSSLAASLNPQEQALLTVLLKRHGDDEKNLKARIDEVNLQIQALIDVLTPLDDQTINTSMHLKAMLVTNLKELRDEVMDLGDLEDLDVDELDAEVD